MTHELLSRQEIAPRIQSAIQNYGYMLILDEVLEVIQPVPNIVKNEALMLFEQGWIAADAETGYVRWLRGDEETSRFKDIRTKARSHALIWYDETLFLWLFPIGLLQVFERVYVLTFMFAASHLKHYLDLHGIGYTYAHVEDGALLEGQENIETRQRQLSSLIDVYEGPLNDIGKDESALSKSWFRKNRSTGKVRHLFNNARNMLMNRYKSGVNEAMWTCFRDEKKRLGLKGYATAFCACNSRATNEYRHRKHLAYLVNVYDHPYIVRWFAASNIHLDAEAFALSQLLQWLWRSALREGEPVTLYIPSSRMRRLLCKWLGKTTT